MNNIKKKIKQIMIGFTRITSFCFQYLLFIILLAFDEFELSSLKAITNFHFKKSSSSYSGSRSLFMNENDCGRSVSLRGAIFIGFPFSFNVLNPEIID